MAFEAFILVNVTGDHTKSAYKTLTRLEGIKGVYMVTGVYDLVVQVAAQDLNHLGDVIRPTSAPSTADADDDVSGASARPHH
jgi:DNA-binding Lrp family transcriptional regulator